LVDAFLASRSIVYGDQGVWSEASAGPGATFAFPSLSISILITPGDRSRLLTKGLVMHNMRLSKLSLLVVLLASACGSASETANTGTTAHNASTTTFVSSWKSPTAQPLHMQGAKVAAVVLMSDLAARRAAEDKLASELTARGAQGVPMYSIMEQPNVEGEPIARDALEKAEVQGVVVMHPTGSQQQAKTAAEYGQAPYDTYWSGYYAYGWASPYPSSPTPSYDTVVSVETLIYSLKQNQLVWAGTSKTTNPASVNDLIAELATATAGELSHLALLAPQ
jgi:hypothetical protein